MRERGAILLAALVVTMLVATVIAGAAYDATMRLRMRTQAHDAAMALICAQAGLENAQRMASTDTTLSTTDAVPLWISDKTVGAGRVSVTASDPGDGMLATSGAALSSTADTVRLSAAGQAGNVTRTLAAEYVRLPHAALKCAVYARTTLGLQDVSIEGRLRANDNVSIAGGAVAVRGDITTRNGATIDPSLADADTDTFYVATALGRPDPDFAWFRDAGEMITLPFLRILDGMILAPGFSNKSPGSPEGIYWVDAAGGPLSISNSVLIACLVVLNASTVSVQGLFSSATRYHHESPDPDRLPALLVQGDLTMRIKYAEWSASILGTPRDFTSGLDGVFFCTGSFWGPQLSATTPIEVHGSILGADVHLVGAGTLFRHDLDLNLNPIAELTLSGLRLIPNTRREL